jgi:hypothetical protein
MLQSTHNLLLIWSPWASDCTANLQVASEKISVRIYVSLKQNAQGSQFIKGKGLFCLMGLNVSIHD